MRPRFLSLLGFLCHCAAAHRAASPRASLSSLVTAAHVADADAIYSMLPASARRAEPLPAFRARIALDQAELRELGASVALTLSRRRAPAAVVALASGDCAYLQEDPAGFGLSHPGFGATAAPTPVDSLRSLRAALSRRSLGSLDAVLSASARGSLDALRRSLLDALRDPASLEISLTNQQASARLPDGRTIILVREDGQWRVDDIHDGAP